uniref:Uncharacterized protein n=1 Tax=Picea glauca TaxID=3330 RepID=A0A101LXZ7_PICGL|nr:hypothetical protein ABT39_MTgene5620 [Picea glauca]QHR88069.1 hypothetical protein Q903MT_gene2082 [Picea sitchensis]
MLTGTIAIQLLLLGKRQEMSYWTRRLTCTQNSNKSFSRSALAYREMPSRLFDR